MARYSFPKKTPAATRLINREQMKYLTSHLQLQARNKTYESRKKDKEPVTVRRARVIVENFEREVRMVERKRMAEIATAVTKLEQLFFVCTPEKALEALETFSKAKFK